VGLLSRSLVTALLVTAPSAAAAQDYPLTRQDVTPRRDYGFDIPVGSLLPTEEAMARYRSMAEEIGRQSTQETLRALRAKGLEMGVLPPGETPAGALAAAPGTARLPDGLRVSILISRAMGEGAITDLLESYRLRKDVRFVFRGVPPGMSVPEFAFWLKELVAPGEAQIEDLNIIIDPELFELSGATLAPTMLLEDLNAPSPEAPAGLDAGRIVARAEGISDPDWLYAQMLKGRTNEKSPNVVEVEEEDLRLRAEREAALVAARLTRDADVIRQRYWDRTGRELRRMNIPPASADRLRQLQFLFRAEKPIIDHQGNTLALTGEVFQPGDVLPFDRRIFVFNPNIPAEADFVAARMQERRSGVSRTLLIVTELPQTEAGQQPWDGLQAIIDRFGIQVFLLNGQVRDAFSIEASPTEIYPEDHGGRIAVFNEESAL
jgi:hypothetical protein